MITRNEILETNSMISEMNLDVRTITMGISLLDCADADINKYNEKVLFYCCYCFGSIDNIRILWFKREN